MSQTNLGNTELYIILALISCFAICWSVTFIVLKGKDEILKVLLAEGNLLRMIAVVFIVGSVATLALVGKLSGDVTTAIFSGIAGYVLGGISKKQN